MRFNCRGGWQEAEKLQGEMLKINLEEERAQLKSLFGNRWGIITDLQKFNLPATFQEHAPGVKPKAHVSLAHSGVCQWGSWIQKNPWMQSRHEGNVWNMGSKIPQASIMVADGGSREHSFFFFLPRRVACGILLPRPGTEPTPPAMEVRSLNHWTAREVPAGNILEVPDIKYKFSFLQRPELISSHDSQ